ncbi:hypothetical protein ABW19_dt0205900 [Dactylella cylindrospora]|nr:hypothetical protein ABW19_dt0205900 [Dactylella cylindrospora]
MPLSFFSRSRLRSTAIASRSIKTQDISVPLASTVTIPDTPRYDYFRRTACPTALGSTYHSLQPFQSHGTSKGDLLSHALHLARLAVILDKVEMYTGAARAYYDCCYLLSTVEPLLGSVELDITHQIRKAYKQRLSHLSIITPATICSSLSLPDGIVPTPELNIARFDQSIKPTQLAELNRISQLLHALSQCCQIIQELDAESYSFKAQSLGGQGLTSLSFEFEKLRGDITRFAEFYTRDGLTRSGASNVLFVLLGSFRRKVTNLLKKYTRPYLLLA